MKTHKNIGVPIIPAGLQLADLIAHPSRSEILYENKLLDKPLAPFSEKIIKILQLKSLLSN